MLVPRGATELGCILGSIKLAYGLKSRMDLEYIYDALQQGYAWGTLASVCIAHGLYIHVLHTDRLAMLISTVKCYTQTFTFTL